MADFLHERRDFDQLLALVTEERRFDRMLVEKDSWMLCGRTYNELVTAWSGIEQATGVAGVIGSQSQLDI